MCDRDERETVEHLMMKCYVNKRERVEMRVILDERIEGADLNETLNVHS
jgi:hypothetical protein